LWRSLSAFIWNARSANSGLRPWCRRRARHRESSPDSRFSARCPCSICAAVRIATRTRLGGLQFGYNYLVAPTWLAGIEAELDWTSAQGKSNFVDPAGTASLSITSDHNWYDTLSGRVGYVMGPLMLYAKGGAAWMNADYLMQVNSGLDGSTLTNTTRPGWIAGGGLEYMLGSRWSVKLEYDHLGFGSKTLAFVNPFGNSVTFESAVNRVKAGVNYHFDGLL
jgi:opacity protein-like surface antigen